jgi:tetratricopeptide (TPR) repeat protein
MRWWASFILTAILAVVPELAGAEEQQDRARALFVRGAELFGAEDYEAALEAFQESHRLNPVDSALYNIAMCQRALFRYVESRETFRQYLVAGGETIDEARRHEVQRSILELEELLGELRLTVVPQGAQLYLDEVALAPERWNSMLVRTGRHTLRAEAEGYQPWVRQLDISMGTVTEVTVSLMPDAVAEAGQGGAVETTSGAKRILRSWWLWTALGLVVAGGAATGIALAVTHDGGKTLGGGDWSIQAP